MSAEIIDLAARRARRAAPRASLAPTLDVHTDPAPTASWLCGRCMRRTVRATEVVDRMRYLTSVALSPARRLTHGAARTVNLHLQAVLTVCGECEIEAWIEAQHRDHDARREAARARRERDKRLAAKRAKRAARKAAS